MKRKEIVSGKEARDHRIFISVRGRPLVDAEVFYLARVAKAEGTPGRTEYHLEAKWPSDRINEIDAAISEIRQVIAQPPLDQNGQRHIEKQLARIVRAAAP